tara:strand:- start:110 stop:532 length:423 start_codon:yes stop_codon:yes gene_type:complete
MTKNTVEDYLLNGEKKDHFLITDVATHGCSGGTISDLIYYDDTVKFYNEHEDEIWDELNAQAEDQGVTIPFLISDFSYSYIKMISDIKTFKNCLAWWICEHVATRISDAREDEPKKMDTFDQIDHLEKRALLDAQMNGDE